MPLPDGLRRDDVQIAYPTTVAEVICGDKTGVPAANIHIHIMSSHIVPPDDVTGHLRGGHWSSWPVKNYCRLLCELLLRLSGNVCCVRV